MKTFKKTIVAASLFGLSQLAIAAAPVMNIDFPTNNQTVSGATVLIGWAVGNEEITETALFIDGNKYSVLPRGSSRDDVRHAFPDFADAENAGFAGAIGTRDLSNGAHELTVTSTNILGETSSKTIIINVSNAPGGVLQASVAYDFSQAEMTVLSPTKVALSKVRINGVDQNVVLEMDNATHNFVMTSFKHDVDRDGVIDHEGCADDIDCDGIDDEHDKFDDDSSKGIDDDDNGLDDSDENHDNPGATEDCFNDDDCDGDSNVNDHDDDNDGIDDDDDDDDSHDNDLDGDGIDNAEDTDDDNDGIDDVNDTDDDNDGIDDENDIDDDNDGINDDHDNDDDDEV